MNAKARVWHSGSTDQRGEQVAEFLLSTGLAVANRESAWSTFQDGRGRMTNIDVICYTENLSERITGWKVSPDLLSDHRRLNITLETDVQVTADVEDTCLRTNLAATNWYQLARELERGVKF